MLSLISTPTFIIEPIFLFDSYFLAWKSVNAALELLGNLWYLSVMLMSPEIVGGTPADIEGLMLSFLM